MVYCITRHDFMASSHWVALARRIRRTFVNRLPRSRKGLWCCITRHHCYHLRLPIWKKAPKKTWFANFRAMNPKQWHANTFKWQIFLVDEWSDFFWIDVELESSGKPHTHVSTSALSTFSQYLLCWWMTHFFLLFIYITMTLWTSSRAHSTCWDNRKLGSPLSARIYCVVAFHAIVVITSDYLYKRKLQLQTPIISWSQMRTSQTLF